MKKTEFDTMQRNKGNTAYKNTTVKGWVIGQWGIYKDWRGYNVVYIPLGSSIGTFDKKTTAMVIARKANEILDHVVSKPTQKQAVALKQMTINVKQDNFLTDRYTTLGLAKKLPFTDIYHMLQNEVLNDTPKKSKLLTMAQQLNTLKIDNVDDGLTTLNYVWNSDKKEWTNLIGPYCAKCNEYMAISRVEFPGILHLNCSCKAITAQASTRRLMKVKRRIGNYSRPHCWGLRSPDGTLVASAWEYTRDHAMSRLAKIAEEYKYRVDWTIPELVVYAEVNKKSSEVCLILQDDNGKAVERVYHMTREGCRELLKAIAIEKSYTVYDHAIGQYWKAE